MANSASDALPPDAAPGPSGKDNHHYVFLSGAISGVVEGVSIQPLELLKTRFQIHSGASLRLIPTLKEIIREGGLMRLYRGGLPEITGLIPRATAALSTLEFSQRTFRSWNTQQQLTAPYAYLAGALSGATESIVFTPFQVRLMAKEHLGRYRNTLDCLYKVVSTEGVSALMIGLGPTLWRNCVWNCLYYGTMYELETHYLGPPLDSEMLQTARDFAVGMCVGFTATCFNAPFDVVKSRVQSQLPGQRTYTSTLQALTHIYTHEGPKALYRGFLPKALRLGIGQTIGLMMFKSCLSAFGVRETD